MYTFPLDSRTFAYNKQHSNRFIKSMLYLCITVIFFSDWLYFVFGIGSRYISWMPELFSIFLSLYIPAVIAINKDWRLPPKYFLLLFMYIVHIAVGFVVNSIAIGPMIAGTRQFCRFIPIFILPTVINFNEDDMRKLLKFLLFLALIQFPVTIWQKFFLYAQYSSGDPIGGTLGENTSGVLSVFLLMVLSFLTAFYLKRLLPLSFFITFCIIVFIPTTLNETKVTLPLLFVAFLLPVIFAKKILIRAPSKIFNLCLILLLTFFLFIFIYNSFSNRDILQFYSKNNQAASYSEGRIVPILTALDKTFHDGLKTLIYGYGAGNVSASFTEYMQSKLFSELSIYDPGKVSLTKLLWETGYIGTLIFLTFIALIFFDSFILSKQNGQLSGAIALGLASATIIYAITFIYTKPLDQNIFAYIFFFFSGYVVTQNKL